MAFEKMTYDEHQGRDEQDIGTEKVDFEITPYDCDFGINYKCDICLMEAFI